MNEISLFEISLALIELPTVGWTITSGDIPVQSSCILLEDSSSLLLEDKGLILVE